MSSKGKGWMVKDFKIFGIEPWPKEKGDFSE